MDSRTGFYVHCGLKKQQAREWNDIKMTFTYASRVTYVQDSQLQWLRAKDVQICSDHPGKYHFFFWGGSPYSEIYRGGPDFNLFSYTYRIRHPSALNTMVPTCFPHKTSQFFPLTLTRCTSVAAPFGRHGQCSAPLKVPHLLAAPWEIWHGTWELCKISIADWSS